MNKKRYNELMGKKQNKIYIRRYDFLQLPSVKYLSKFHNWFALDMLDKNEQIIKIKTTEKKKLARKKRYLNSEYKRLVW